MTDFCLTMQDYTENKEGYSEISKRYLVIQVFKLIFMKSTIIL